MELPDKITLLLVDDEEDIREVLGIALTDRGYNVLLAENGKEALELFRKEKPPIVITDIKMPGTDGIELLRKMKRENQDTEVIMITGHGDLDLAIKSLKYEAVDYIVKPIDDDALVIALKRACDKIVTRQTLRGYTENLEALVREKSVLQDHLASLGFMIGSISHGIKGLLARLDGGVYLIESCFARKEYDEVKDGLDVVKLTVDRIKKMVLDILYYAKERGLKRARVNIFDFASEVADFIEPKIQDHPVEFIRDFSQAPSEFEIDAEILRSALINILDNAVDACLEDEATKTHKIVFGIKQDNKDVIFDVYDNGIGMDRKTKENIFGLFYSSKESRGTGLGLFIANNIIKQHGGSINVTSIKGKGTHFSVRIPIANQ